MFRQNPALLAMLHVPALPGTPRAGAPIAEICAHVQAESKQLQQAGFDGLIIENMHDTPYLRQSVGPEIVAAMTAVGVAVRSASDLPLGVQVLAGAAHETLAVALACGADFIRVENFIFAHVADEGLMTTAAAGPLLRYRKSIDAEHIGVFADIKKKHASHAITADIDLGETAAAAEFAGADGLIVTGTATGRPTAPADVQAVRDGSTRPVWVGSGVTPEQLPELWPIVDGLIVGSYLKQDGRWQNPLDPARIARLCQAAADLRA